MDNQAEIELLQAEVDENDESFFRLLVDGRSIKYITVEPGIYSAEDMCFGPSLVFSCQNFPQETGTMDEARMQRTVGHIHFCVLQPDPIPSRSAHLAWNLCRLFGAFDQTKVTNGHL